MHPRRHPSVPQCRQPCRGCGWNRSGAPGIVGSLRSVHGRQQRPDPGSGSRLADRVVPAQPRAVPPSVRPDRSGRVLLPADRVAQPDRVLRRAPAGVQHHLADQPGARAARHRRPAGAAVRAGHRSRHGGQRGATERSLDPVAEPPGGAGVRPRCRRGGPDGAAGCSVRGGSSGDAAWRGGVHRARARGHAPGNAALHVASPAARPQASTRRSGLRARRYPAGRETVRNPRR